MFKVKLAKFQKNAVHSIQNLFEEEHLTDVTLVSHDDQQIYAHRIVLGSSSGFFKKLFSRNSANKHPLVYLRGINYQELKALVTYIYKGEVELQKEDMESFFKTGFDLEVLGLKDMEDFPQNQLEEPGEVSLIDDTVDNPRSLAESIDLAYNDIKLENIEEIRDPKTNEDKQKHIKLPSKLNHNISKTKEHRHTGNVNEQDSTHSRTSRLQCATCDKIFLDKQVLRKHIRRVHNTVVHSCSHCFQKYKRSEHLRRHFDTIHGPTMKLDS